MMNQTRRAISRLVTGVAVAVVLLWAGVVAQADVTIKRTASTKGMAGILDAEIKSEDCIQNDKSCNDAETRSTNKLMKFVTGGKPAKTSSISRPRKNLV